MSTTTSLDKVQKLAIDLRTGYPRSASEQLAGYAIAPRAIDKCRAELMGWQGEYHYDCPLSHIFLDYAEIQAADLKAFLATGATDEEAEKWITEHAKKREPIEILRWSQGWREKKLSDLEDGLLTFMEGYVKENTPKGSWAFIKTWFDVYDVEEKRIRVS